MNPPYGVRAGHSQPSLFLQTGLVEYASGRVSEVLLVMKAAVGYQWFSKLPHASFLSNVEFMQVPVASSVIGGSESQGVSSSNSGGSVAMYLGTNIQRFCIVLSQVTLVPGSIF